MATISAAVLDSSGKLVMEAILETKAETILPLLGKVGAVVRYKRVVLGADDGHEFPVFGAAETEITDMMHHVTRAMRYFD